MVKLKLSFPMTQGYLRSRFEGRDAEAEAKFPTVRDYEDCHTTMESNLLLRARRAELDRDFAAWVAGHNIVIGVFLGQMIFLVIELICKAFGGT